MNRLFLCFLPFATRLYALTEAISQLFSRADAAQARFGDLRGAGKIPFDERLGERFHLVKEG